MKLEKVEVYRLDIKVKKQVSAKKKDRQFEGVNKKEIMEFTQNSERNLMFICRNSGHHIRSQIALTYHFNIPANGVELKKQMNCFLIAIQRQYGKLYYLWVLEFQERGAPHFHFFSSLPQDDVICRVVGRIWNRVVKESEQHLRFQQDSRSMISWKMTSGKYLSNSYISKQKQKQVPENFQNVGRFWGASRNMKPEKEILFLSDQENRLDNMLVSTVRIVTKGYESKLKKLKVKKNYRRQTQSYSLPSTSIQFKKILGDKICGNTLVIKPKQELENQY